MLNVCAMVFLLLFLANAFCFMLFLGLFTHSLLFQVKFSIMRSAFDLLVYPDSLFTQFLCEWAMCSLEK